LAILKTSGGLPGKRDEVHALNDVGAGEVPSVQ
jgi:hypothetical protein